MRIKPKFCLPLLCLAALARQTDPWPQNVMLAPTILADQIKSATAPPIVFVGFPVLYRSAHIPNAIFAGPCSKPDGLALLAKAAKDIPHDRELVIYCGCCPFVHCPNVRPAYTALKSAGFTNIKILELDTNLHTDWIEKGYPIERQQ